jgi:hypothetical protein
VEAALLAGAARPAHADDHAAHVFEEYVVVDAGGRLQVPIEVLEQARIGDRATLEVTDEGLLVRPVAGRSAPVTTEVTGLAEEEPPQPRRRGLREWWKRMTKDD